MEVIIKELKDELLNKEITLLELDNEAERITGSTTSLFDFEEDCINQTSASYYMDKDKNIILEFKIIKKEENNLDTIVKVTDIWED